LFSKECDCLVENYVVVFLFFLVETFTVSKGHCPVLKCAV